MAVQHDGAADTMENYFASEAAASEGGCKEPPAELKAQMDEMDALSIGVPEFFGPQATMAVSHAEQTGSALSTASGTDPHQVPDKESCALAASLAFPHPPDQEG